MAKSLLKDNRIALRTSFFGLSSKAVFLPSESVIRAYVKEYSSENSQLLKQLLAYPKDKLEEFQKRHTTIESTSVGPARLEMGVSDDRQFVAVQLFGYFDFSYSPLTDVLIYEGADAGILCSILI